MDNHNKVNNEADIQANIKANIHEDRPADSEKDIQAAGSEDFQEELVKLRRYFHEHPELSWQEYHTQEKIMEYLDELGIPYKNPVKPVSLPAFRERSQQERLSESGRILMPFR